MDSEVEMRKITFMSPIVIYAMADINMISYGYFVIFATTSPERSPKSQHVTQKAMMMLMFLLGNQLDMIRMQAGQLADSPMALRMVKIMI
jgi:hypothetical protein